MPVLIKRWWLRIARLVACLLLLSVVGCERPQPSWAGTVEAAFNESSQMLEDANRQLLSEMKSSAEVNVASSKYDRWLPSARAVQDEANSFTAYLNKIGGEDYVLAISAEKENIYGRVMKLRTVLAGIFDTTSLSNDYPAFCSHLLKDGVEQSELFAKRFRMPVGDDPTATSDRFMNAWIKGSPSRQEWLSVLAQWRSAAQRTAYGISSYCSNQVCRLAVHYTKVTCIAIVDKGQVKAGQTIEVTAGIGEFGLSRKPMILIDGALRNTNNDGVVQYTFVATGKPGKYQLPVHISFETPDGSRQSILKMVEYLIVP